MKTTVVLFLVLLVTACATAPQPERHTFINERLEHIAQLMNARNPKHPLILSESAKNFEMSAVLDLNDTASIYRIDHCIPQFRIERRGDAYYVDYVPEQT